MRGYKVFTDETHPKHRIIKALLKKGYTGLKLEWFGAMTQTRGFTLQCNQISWMKVGACIEHSLANIELMPNVDSK